MKKLLLGFFAGTVILLTGCLETTQEIMLKEDGSGTYLNTNDMSKILTIAKNMGDALDGKIPQNAVDTSFSFASMSDSIPDLSAEDKELMKKGQVRIQMDMADENLVIAMSFPFTTLNDITKFNKLSGKMLMETLKGNMGNKIQGGAGAMPETSSFDDYYTLEFSDGELKKKLNKDKYNNVDNDEFLNGMKQAGSMGIPVSDTYIINLPRPAEKAEGKNVKLSEDKKKVTVTSSLDDFFDNPESLEFKIKY